MSLAYRIAYRVGVTPWERKDPASLRQLGTLLDREEEEQARPYGKALDVGCGTGAHTVDLARRGWDATGVDGVARALEAARAKARDAGIEAAFVEADVTALGSSVGTGFALALDLGCFHGLTPEQRASYAAELSRVTAPGAALLMFAFGPAGRGPMPRGVDREGVEAAFSDWTFSYEEPVDLGQTKGMVRKAAPRWYRLARGDA